MSRGRPILPIEQRKVTASFSLKNSTIDLLERCAKRFKLSKSQTLTNALEIYAIYKRVKR